MRINSFSDSELLEQLRQDNEVALDIIFKKYWQPLFISAFNLLKDKATCEDIIQDIFIRVWDRRYEIEIRTSLKAYLFASMRYEVFRQIKVGNARADIFEGMDQVFEEPSPYEDLVHKELLAKVDLVIESLPDKCREVYRLSREEQLSHKEISEKLNISPKTVETHITKALKHMRISLKEIVTLQIIYFFIK
jgi:RNA polymerase sigma-70 factor (ECF subfamily)